MNETFEIGSLTYISHSYKSPYQASSYNASNRSGRYVRSSYLSDKRSNASKAGRPYGNYKSPYYDPVARHERYIEERDSGKLRSSSGAKIGSGTKGSSGKSSGSSGKASGSSGKASGSSGKASGSSGKASGSSGKASGSSGKALQLAIKKLSDESSINSDVQREVTRRKIEDLQNQLSDRIKELRKNAYDSSQSETNSAERRGIVQNLRTEIQSLQEKSSKEAERISKDLSSWISNEQKSLGRKIAALQGTKYDENADKVKEQQQKKRDKEVNSRADAIYKSKTKKK